MAGCTMRSCDRFFANYNLSWMRLCYVAATFRLEQSFAASVGCICKLSRKFYFVQPMLERFPPPEEQRK